MQHLAMTWKQESLNTEQDWHKWITMPTSTTSKFASLSMAIDPLPSLSLALEKKIVALVYMKSYRSKFVTKQIAVFQLITFQVRRSANLLSTTNGNWYQ